MSGCLLSLLEGPLIFGSLVWQCNWRCQLYPTLCYDKHHLLQCLITTVCLYNRIQGYYLYTLLLMTLSLSPSPTWEVPKDHRNVRHPYINAVCFVWNLFHVFWGVFLFHFATFSGDQRLLMLVIKGIPDEVEGEKLEAS